MSRWSTSLPSDSRIRRPAVGLRMPRISIHIAPRLTSGGYEVGVITPSNTLFRGGGEFRSLMKIKLMLLPQATHCSEGVANLDPL